MDERHADYVEYYRVRAAKYDNSPMYPESRAAEHALLEAFEHSESLEEARTKIEAGNLTVANAAALVRDQERTRAACYDELDEPVRARAPKAVMAAIDGITDPIELVNAANRARTRELNVEVIDELVRTIEADFTPLETLEVWQRAEIPDRWRSQYDGFTHDLVEDYRHLWAETRLPAARQWDPNWTLDYRQVWEPRHRRRIPLPDDLLRRRLEQHHQHGWG